MRLSQKCQKSDFLVVEKLMRKPNKIHEGHTKILVCITCGINVLKNPPEAAKIATLVNFFNVGKT